MEKEDIKQSVENTKENFCKRCLKHYVGIEHICPMDNKNK